MPVYPRHPDGRQWKVLQWELRVIRRMLSSKFPAACDSCPFRSKLLLFLPFRPACRDNQSPLIKSSCEFRKQFRFQNLLVIHLHNFVCMTTKARSACEISFLIKHACQVSYLITFQHHERSVAKSRKLQLIVRITVEVQEKYFLAWV